MFVLAHMGANNRLLILFMLNGAQTSNVGRVGEELGTLIGLFDILRHTSKRSGVELLKLKKKKKKKKKNWWSLKGRRSTCLRSLIVGVGKGVWELMNLP